jgi:hypothetical protein
MPFNYLLTNLLVDVPSAVGAIFLDAEGEAVEWVTRHGDPYDLKVEGAYHSIFRRALEGISPDAEIGTVASYVMEGELLIALTHTLPEGYYVVLVLDRTGPRAQALYHLRRAATVLARELD